MWNQNKFAEIIFGVPQGSIVRPLLFNIYVCDLFFENSDINIANYADDNTPYAQEIHKHPQESFEISLSGFP